MLNHLFYRRKFICSENEIKSLANWNNFKTWFINIKKRL